MSEKVSKIRWVVLIAFFFLTYFSIYLGKLFEKESAGRIVALILFFIGGAFAIFYFGFVAFKLPLRSGVNPITHKRVVTSIGIGAIILGLLFLITSTTPFVKDLAEIIGGREPEIIEGKVTDISTPLFGLWFIREGVGLNDNKDARKRYSLYFSFTPLRRNETYEFKVLPNSRAILEFKKIN